MRIYVDLTTQKLVVGPGQSQERGELQLVRSASATIEVQFLRDSVVVELEAGATGVIEFKTVGKYDQSPAVTGSDSWTPSGAGDQRVYAWTVPLSGGTIDSQLHVNGTDTDDVEFLELMCGVQWDEGGNVNETFKVLTKLYNDVVRVGDVLPTMPPYTHSVFPTGVSSLADFKAIPTTAAQLGYLVEILIVVSGQLSYLTYRLVAGPVTDVEPGQVEPDDYDLSTNNKHWQGAVGPSGTNGIPAGMAYKWNTTILGTGPGTGKLNIDNASPASAAVIYLSETDDDGVARATLFLTWDDSTSTRRGRLTVVDPVNPSNYAIFDLIGSITDSGAYDSFAVVPISNGGALTNNLPVRLFFVAKGDKGDTGATGAGFVATSATSFTPGTGSKVFVTQAGLAYTVGARVRVSSAAGPTTNWMEGVVTAYSTTNLTVLIDKFLGSGAHADWNVNAAGEPGVGFTATSVTSFTPGTGSKAFATQAGLAYTIGARVRASSTASPTTTWMEGVVTAYAATTLTVLVDRFLGTGSHIDWDLNAAGEPGASYVATSTTSFTPGTGSKAFTTQAGLAYLVGARVRASSAAGPITTWMEGIVTAYSGTTLTVTIDLFAGSGAHTDWNLNVAGERGATGATGGTTYDAAIAIPAGTTGVDIDLTTTSMSLPRVLTANTDFDLVNPVDGKVTIVHIKQAAASSFTVTFNGTIVWVGTGGSQPPQSTGFDVIDAWTFWYAGATLFGTWSPGE